MYYIVIGVSLLVALAFGFYSTLSVDKKLEKDES